MDTASPDLYAVLGVDPRASRAQIRAAHRRLIKQLHPDVGGSVERFLQVEQAYRTLADADARLAYDVSLGLAGPGPGTADPGAADGSGAFPRSRTGTTARTGADASGADPAARGPSAGAGPPGGGRRGSRAAQASPGREGPAAPTERAGWFTELVVRVLRAGRRVGVVGGAVGGLTAGYERRMARSGVITRGGRPHTVTWTMWAGLYGAGWYGLQASGWGARLADGEGFVPARFWGADLHPGYFLLFGVVGVAVAWQTWIPPLRRMGPRRRQRLWVRALVGLLYAALTWGLYAGEPRTLQLAGLTAVGVVVVTTPWLWLLSGGLRRLGAGAAAAAAGLRRRLRAWWDDVQARV